MPAKSVMAGPVIVTGVVGIIVGIDVTVGVGFVGDDPFAECVGVMTDVATLVAVPALLAVLPCVGVELFPP